MNPTELLTHLFRLEQAHQALTQDLIALMQRIRETELKIHQYATHLNGDTHIVKTDAGHFCIHRKTTPNRIHHLEIHPISTNPLPPKYPITHLPNAFDS